MSENKAKFASQLNSVLYRAGATEEAVKQMTPENMKAIKKEFFFIKPFVQAVLLQSVIHLKAEEFDAISADYTELVLMAQNSKNEWVRNIAINFENYPNIKMNTEPINFSEVSLLNQNSSSQLFASSSNNNSTSNIALQFQQQEQINSSNKNYRVEGIKPPSQNYAPPKSLKEISAAQQNKATSSFFNKNNDTNNNVVNNTNNKNSSNLDNGLNQIPTRQFFSAPPRKSEMMAAPPPSAKPKEKVLMDMKGAQSPYFNNNTQKNKSQLTLFSAFNKK